jgi:hypothetical protein
MKRLFAASRDRERPARRRGFTLVELMVAVTGGLFVSIAVFMLAKHSTGFYQSEARVGNATFGNLVGFNRLRTDIARAGYLTTPNVRTDPSVCGDPTVNSWPARLEELASIRITQTATVPSILSDPDNGRQPDEILLAGSYASPDQFETGPIFVSGTTRAVQLRFNSTAMARLGYLDANAAQQTALLESVFGTGRALRIVDKTGGEQYGRIVGVQNGTQPQVLINPTSPPFQERATSAFRCGINDLGVGSLVNVVNLVRYRIQEASGAEFAGFDPAVNPSTEPPTDAERTELVRSELDVNGDVIASTVEVVAEFAVDLKFGISVANTISPPSVAGAGWDQTTLTTFAPGTNQVYNWANDPSLTSANQGPERIRSIRARLSVRSREADRQNEVPTGSSIAPGFYRMKLGTDDDGFPLYARVRTVQADIALRNQLNSI